MTSIAREHRLRGVLTLCSRRSLGVPVATTDVRFTGLSISSTVAVGGRSLPSLTNDIINMLQVS